MLQIVDRRKMRGGHIDNGKRIEHASWTHIPTCLTPAIWTPNEQPARRQNLKVMLGRGIAVHLLVHRWHDGDRCGRSQTNR
ncbi:hypothetical protein D3C80_1420560 [compost metagenome]